MCMSHLVPRVHLDVVVFPMNIPGISIQIPLLIVPFFEIYIGEVHQNCTVKLFRQLPCHAVMKHPTFFAQFIQNANLGVQ